MTRVYATAEQLADYTGQPAPADAVQQLTRASRFLDAHALNVCLYDTDDAGMPTAPEVLDALREAVCVQLQWWDDVGDSTGAMGAGWGAVALGPVSLSRAATDVAPEASPARRVAPEIWDILGALPLEVIRVGVVW